MVLLLDTTFEYHDEVISSHYLSYHYIFYHRYINTLKNRGVKYFQVKTGNKAVCLSSLMKQNITKNNRFFLIKGINKTNKQQL